MRVGVAGLGVAFAPSATNETTIKNRCDQVCEGLDTERDVISDVNQFVVTLDFVPRKDQEDCAAPYPALTRWAYECRCSAAPRFPTHDPTEGSSVGHPVNNSSVKDGVVSLRAERKR